MKVWILLPAQAMLCCGCVPGCHPSELGDTDVLVPVIDTHDTACGYDAAEESVLADEYIHLFCEYSVSCLGLDGTVDECIDLLFSGVEPNGCTPIRCVFDICNIDEIQTCTEASPEGFLPEECGEVFECE